MNSHAKGPKCALNGNVILKWCIERFTALQVWNAYIVHRGAALATMCVFGSMLALGCSGAEHADFAELGDALQERPQGTFRPCVPGTQRECGITLKQKTDLISCFEGVQECQDDETWGDCMDVEPEVADERSSNNALRAFARSRPSVNLQSLSSVSPATCNDLCDPQCRQFLEPVPVAGSSGYQGVIPGSSCTHDVCTVDQKPLTTGCCTDPNDPNCCIAKICAKDSTCCQTSWHQGCVDLMYTQCLNRAPPFSLCDFGVYSEQGILTKNRPAAGASIGSKGNVTMGTDATPKMIVAGGNLDIKSPNGKSIQTPGGVWVGGNVTAENGGGATYTGDWNVGGFINLKGGNTVVGKVYARGYVRELGITGDAYSGSTFTSVTGTGKRVANSNHAAPVIQMPAGLPTLPKPPVLANGTCPAGTNYTVDNGVRTLSPGSYGTLTMQNVAKVTLEKPGTYTFAAINAASVNNGGLQIGKNATAGKYTVIVCGAVSFGNFFTIINHTADSTKNTDRPVLVDPGRLVLYAGSTVTFGTDGKFAGVLIAPNNKVTVADRTTVNGAIWSKDFEAGTDMAAVGISKAACEALEIPGTAPVANACTIQTVVTEPLVVDEYEYEADCPVATTARWKTLTWDTTVPNNSSITFKAKVGKSLTELASASFTTLGVAKPGNPNTTKCSAAGPGPLCPVPLTDKLGLGMHQGQYLSLRIERDATGGMPQITDWKVSYSCQYHE